MGGAENLSWVGLCSNLLPVTPGNIAGGGVMIRWFITSFTGIRRRNPPNPQPSIGTDYDLQCLVRFMREEQRHGWQMCHLLVNHFGDSGKLEAKENTWMATGSA